MPKLNPPQTHTVNSRSEFIEYGAYIAGIVGTIKSGKPPVICINGSCDGGKSLFALAVDYARHPERYRNGLTSDICAKNFLNWKTAADSKTYFDDLYGRQELGNTGIFNKTLQDLIDFNPKSDLFIISNLETQLGASFSPQAVMSSDITDLSLHFQTLPGDFTRCITTAFAAPRVLDKVLAKAGKPVTLSGLLARPSQNPGLEQSQ